MIRTEILTLTPKQTEVKENGNVMWSNSKYIRQFWAKLLPLVK